MSLLSKGRPSLSQLRVGGGTPSAEHSNSRRLFTAKVSSTGKLELIILGGSEWENGTFWIYFHYLHECFKSRGTLNKDNYRARWGWSSWCCFQPGCLPHSCRGLHLKELHPAAAAAFPVHPAAGCGAGTAADHLSSMSEWGEGHHVPHRSGSPGIPEPLWLALLVPHDPHQGALQTANAHLMTPVNPKSFLLSFQLMVWVYCTLDLDIIA